MKSASQTVSRYADKLHDAVARYLSAERAFNCLDVIQGGPEEAALQAVVEEIRSAGYVASTAPGAMAALRLSKRELEAVGDRSMAQALVSGAMAYFDNIERALGREGLCDWLRMMEDIAEAPPITGGGYAAIYDGLSTCIQMLDGILSQPRCVETGPDCNRLTSAGEYLHVIEQYLNCERRRVMAAAAKNLPSNHGEGSDAYLQALLVFSLEDADLSFEAKVGLLQQIKAMEAAQ